MFRPRHVRAVTLCAAFLLLFGYLSAQKAAAQTAVVLAPVPQLQFFDQSGRPLAFGCVFTFEVQSTNPLSTYTDFSGETLNQNPVILSAGGTANIWLQAGLAYTFQVKSAGGVKCASGSTLYTVDGIGGGSTVLTTNVTFSSTPTFIDAAQIQLFRLTLTGDATAQPMSFVGVTPPGIIYFQITQDASGGHSFSWPANTIGGCTIGATANQVTTQEFVYNGTDAMAVGPCVTGNGPDISFGDASGADLILSADLTVGGFSGLNGGFGCTEGSGPGGATGGDTMWCDSSAHRFKMNNNNTGADPVVGAATTDTFTHKTYDTAGTGNVFKINGSAVTGTTGTGPNVAFNANPTLVGWNCAIVSKSSGYTLTGADCQIHASAASTSFQITLDHTLVGQFWWITRTDSTSTHTLTIAGDSGNVNGAGSITVAPDSSVICHADGTNSWCQTSPGPNAPLMQWTLLTSGGTTFTYPIQYSATPACFCSGVNGSCNVQTAGVSTSACQVNTTVANTYVFVVGLP